MRNNRARYRLKTAALDPKMLASALSSAQLGEEPETVQFKTPAGHTVTSPYSAETVQHHLLRAGSPQAYYQNLGRALSERGTREDRQIEHERDLRMSQMRAGNTLGGGTLGGLAGTLGGAAIGSLLKQPGMGAAIGGMLGALGGGLYGHSRPVTRPSGVETRHVDDISELYKEPEHVRALKENLSNMEDTLESIQRQQRRARIREFYRDMNSAYDPYDPYDSLYRRRYRGPIYF